MRGLESNGPKTSFLIMRVREVKNGMLALEAYFHLKLIHLIVYITLVADVNVDGLSRRSA